MRNTDQWLEAEAAGLVSADPGTKVLVAIDGFFEPGREGVAGELLMPQPPCWRPRCTCEDGFHGVTSHGMASVGRVLRFRGLSRRLAEAEIAAAMALHEEFDDPDRSAVEYLDEIDSLEEGRLVRREEHALMPFPMAARVAGPHAIQYHLDDEP